MGESSPERSLGKQPLNPSFIGWTLIHTVMMIMTRSSFLFKRSLCSSRLSALFFAHVGLPCGLRNYETSLPIDCRCRISLFTLLILQCCACAVLRRSSIFFHLCKRCSAMPGTHSYLLSLSVRMSFLFYGNIYRYFVVDCYCMTNPPVKSLAITVRSCYVAAIATL